LPGGDTGFNLALKEVRLQAQNNQYQNVYVYLLSDGYDSYPTDTANELLLLKNYLRLNNVYSWFSTIGIAQPDANLMSELINIGCIPGTY